MSKVILNTSENKTKITSKNNEEITLDDVISSLEKGKYFVAKLANLPFSVKVIEYLGTTEPEEKEFFILEIREEVNNDIIHYFKCIDFCFEF